VELIDCTFENKSASNGGGGVNFYTFGNNTSYAIIGCNFRNNEANNGGGLQFFTNENANYASLFVDNCVFDGNKSTSCAGAIYLVPNANNFNTVIGRTKIINNESLFGGAIHSTFNSSDPLAEVATIQIENSLIANNSSDDDAISAHKTSYFSFMNCTIANNQSNGIQLSDEGRLSLQNTILYNPGFTEYQALSNNVSFISLRGNLFGDNSIVNDTICDDVDTDPMFVSDTIFRLQEFSPAIDFGVDWDNLSEYDLEGNGRKYNCVDKGAYESEYVVKDHCSSCTVGNKEIYVNESLSIIPNPALDYLNIELPESITKTVVVSIIDLQGKTLKKQMHNSGQSIDVAQLPAGMYLLKIVVDSRIYTGRFIKQ